jgi:hypothetical protein
LENIYYLRSANQATEYETTTYYLINHIRKTFNFGSTIGTAREELKAMIWTNICRPSLRTSISADADTKEAETKKYEIKIKAEFDAFMNL